MTELPTASIADRRARTNGSIRPGNGSSNVDPGASSADGVSGAPDITIIDTYSIIM
jgi:hypothetical protein